MAYENILQVFTLDVCIVIFIIYSLNTYIAYKEKNIRLLNA